MTKKVTFTLTPEIAEDAVKALLLGDFNSWMVEEGIALKKQKDGSFKGSVELETGKTYQYRYLLDEVRWVNDGSAIGYIFVEEFGIDNCVLVVEDEPVEAPAPAPKKAAKIPAPKAAAPKVAKAAPVADDLTKIEGIGKKIAELLAAEGISDFATLSKTTAKKIKTILEAAGSRFKVHDPTTWPKQAKLAATGKWDELKALQAELKGGK